jgi:RNA polymerase-binding protein DksA
MARAGSAVAGRGKSAAAKKSPVNVQAKKPAARPVAAPAKSVKKPVAPAKFTRKNNSRNNGQRPRPGKSAGDEVRRSARPEANRGHVPPVPTVPDAVPTDGKPRKNQAGFNARELEHFRDLLLAKRRELVGDMSAMEREALRSSGGTNLSNLPIHMADMGTDNYEQEFTLGLVQKDRDLLREINAALAKIQNGTYGLCEGTGQPISKERLEYQPWARYSIEYARQLERRR